MPYILLKAIFSSLSLCVVIFEVGGDTRIRTGDQSFAGSCLTTWLCRRFVVPRAGLEPARKKIRGILSPLCLPFHHLGFTSKIWSGKRDSNSRPQPWQGCALPLSYSRIKGCNVTQKLLKNLFYKNDFQKNVSHKKIKYQIFWGYSSAGRALEWHSRGRRFDPA